MNRRERGQSMVEYLAISLPILLALLALGADFEHGPVRQMADRLMGKAEYQLHRTDHGTVDSFLP